MPAQLQPALGLQTCHQLPAAASEHLHINKPQASFPTPILADATGHPSPLHTQDTIESLALSPSVP